MTTTDTPEGFNWLNPSVVRLIERYTTLNRKALPQDAEQSRVVREVAEYYAANYEDNFLWMCKMRANLEQWGKLSTGQAAGVINCLMAEYKRRQAPVKPASFTNVTNTQDKNVQRLAHVVSFTQGELRISAAQVPHVVFKRGAITYSVCYFANTQKYRLFWPYPSNDQKHWDFNTLDELKVHCETLVEKPAFKMPEATLPDLTTEQRDVDATVRLDRQAAKETAPENAEPVTPVVHNGTYTIVLNEAGDYRTIRLSDLPLNINQPKGTQIAAYLSGRDNEANYTGFAFVTGDTFHLWKSFVIAAAHVSNLGQALAVLLHANAETRAEYGYAYAVESGRCYRCNRKLTVPTSIHRGLGPDCAKK